MSRLSFILENPLFHLKEVRKNMGLSQEDLSFLSGLSQNSISSIEHDYVNVSIYNAFCLANALNCSVYDIFNFEIID